MLNSGESLAIIAVMALASDRCICLRKVEYSETSQILWLFSRGHGIVRVIAKGAHRRTKAGASKFDGGIDLLDSGTAVFTDDPARDLATLTEWKLTDGHLELRRTLRGLYLALYAAELVSLLIEEHDPHAELFDRLEQTLGDLASARIEESFLTLELDALRETGYLPELLACVSCGRVWSERDRAAYFSAASGGIVCGDCEAGIPDRMSIDVRLLRILQSLLRLPRSNGMPQRLPRLTRHQTDPLNRLMAGHVQHTLGRRLRMLPYVIERQLVRAAAVASASI
jgi:DNA repair protein RecO (recombination protein O)